MGSDGKALLTDIKQILERWAEHFSTVLNQQSSIDQATFDNLPQMQTQNILAAAPRVDEILSVIKTLSWQGPWLGRYTGRDPKGWWWCTGTTSIQLVQPDMNTRSNPSGAARRYHSSHLQTKRISLTV